MLIYLVAHGKELLIIHMVESIRKAKHHLEKITQEKDIHMMKQEMRLFLQRNMKVGL